MTLTWQSSQSTSHLSTYLSAKLVFQNQTFHKNINNFMTIVHWTCTLVKRRSKTYSMGNSSPFRTPFHVPRTLSSMWHGENSKLFLLPFRAHTSLVFLLTLWPFPLGLFCSLLPYLSNLLILDLRLCWSSLSTLILLISTSSSHMVLNIQL